MLKQEVKITVAHEAPVNHQTQGLVVCIYEGEKPESKMMKALDDAFGGLLSQLMGRGEITGESKEFHILHNLSLPMNKLIVLGMGEREKFSLETIRAAVAKGARTARKLNQSEVSILMEPFDAADAFATGVCAAEGVIMGLDRFEVYKSKKKSDRDILTHVQFLCEASQVEEMEKGVARGVILAKGNTLARDIANHPGNRMTPALMAEEAHKVAQECGLELEILDEPDLIAAGYTGITAVSAGSEENCKMIKITHMGRPESNEIDIAIVGKGLTFDAGGISIKPASGMHMMKYDMCGGAATIGAAYIVGQLKPKVNVRFYVPASENMPDGKAYKPGDILKFKNGKTVEINNTDAEGRLILADALIMACEEGARRIVDAATLTGAVVTCLGHVRTGLFCKDEGLKSLVVGAAKECDEKIWELPLDDEYRVILKSSHADLSNSGGRAAGSTTAAIFLNEFVGNIPFCHLDIAGTAWVENVPTQYSFKPYLPKDGATGTAARTFALTVEHLAETL